MIDKEKQRARLAKWNLENPERRRAIDKAYYRRDPARNQAKMRRRSVEITPAYVAKTLELPVSALTPEIIVLKRKQLAFARLAKQIKQKLKELNETFTTDTE
jgi:hypothetical protein